MALFVTLPSGGYLDIVADGPTWVHRCLSRGGLSGYEPHTQAAILAVCEMQSPNLVFFDIGCHIGFYTALVAMSFPDSRCVAFEPTPTTLAMTRRTFAANQLDIVLVDKAVSDVEGWAELFVAPLPEMNSLNPAFAQGSTPVSVETVTIDGLVLTGNVGTPTLMKIDVETLEARVLTGGMETIRRFRPWIVCEILGSEATDELEPVLRQLEALGYCFYHATNDAAWPRCDAKTVLTRATRDEFMDWVLSPEPVDRALFESIAEWRAAVAACTPNHSIVVDGLRTSNPRRRM